ERRSPLPGRDARQAAGVLAVASSGKDPPDRVRSLCGAELQEARTFQTGNLQVPGFVLICDKSRRGDFRIRRKSRRDRMCAKLREIKEGLRHRMHRPIPETGKWLAQIVAGYFAYHAVPTNSPALSAFRYHVLVLWHRQLCRRSQRARVLWTRMTKLP